MIGALNGKVAAIGADSMILDVGGVGYEVAPSARVRTMITRSGQELSISIYTDVRENAIALYGFAEASERELFLLLKKVKGVGAKLALAIVSQLEPEVLLSAIGAGDISALKGVSGVGKKTAERLIVELREKVSEMAREIGASIPTGPAKLETTMPGVTAGAPSVAGDVVLALEKLGFPGERARSVVASTIKSQADAQPAAMKDAGELLKLALANL
ncbi:MAG: Holliday junction branch migration protein RuvA [Bdellovibrionales bacterium]|nr:Holliday junction branch migration protein RuvA [Bdellovibrionales bacterium]